MATGPCAPRRDRGASVLNADAISVVIPAYNAARTLPRLLASLAAGADRPEEVLVVDDGSATFEPLSQVGLNVRFIRLDHQGPIVARNAGWRAASGTWIAFLDSDCSVETGWCAAYRRAMADYPEAMILEGPLREVFTNGFFRHWAENLGPGRYPTANVAYRRDVLARIGGLDPLFRWGRFYFREDSDLALRALAHGTAVWVGDAAVLHHGRRIRFSRKLQEACRYALDPGLVLRHGLRAVGVDRVRFGPGSVPAPRQISAITVTVLALGGVLWRPLWALAALAAAGRAAFVLSREGLLWGEVPAAIVEQILEPLVLCGALMAGIARLAGRSRRAGVHGYVV